MQKALCIFLTILMLCSLCTINASAIAEKNNQNIIIDGIAADQYDDSDESNLFFKVIGLFILGFYFAATSIYYFASRKKKEFSLSTCIKNFIPIGATALLLFLLSYMDYPISLDERLCLLFIIVLLVSPICLLATTIFNVMRLLNAKQAEIDDYKEYVKKSLTNITIYFVVTAISFLFLIIYEQIL